MKKKYKVLLWILGVLIAIRLVLPYVVLHFANKSLAEMDGYYGHIEDIDLSIYRGAYTIDNIYLDQVDSVTGEQTDFFSCEKIDLSLEWSALFKGTIAGELVFDKPSLAFTKDKAEPAEVAADSSTFQEMLKDFMPLKINRFEVNDGSIHYIDSTANPLVNIKMDRVHILATNLTNATDDTIKLPSKVTAEAEIYEGTLTFSMKLNILEEKPVFDMNAELKNTNLVLLNDFLQAYGKFDVNQGTFGLYTEIAAEDGEFVGYVKPIIKDLDVVGIEDRENSFFSKVWESIVGGVGEVFENQKKDQLATKVEMAGSFKNPDIRLLNAIMEVLSNAFIQALMPTIDNEISIQSVDEGTSPDGNLFDRLFESDDEKKQEKKEEKKEKKKDK